MENITIIDKKCCGCHACEQVCPYSAISFASDEEGFMQPVVDSNLCVNCGRCLKVCPIQKVCVFDYTQTAYGGRVVNNDDLINSSSGGLFSVLARHIIANGGVVCGCSTDNNMMPYHLIVDSDNELAELRGSKYVQSDTAGIYSKVKEVLNQKRLVLFSGVPCQVAGLRNFLSKDYDNLYCVDIICHGVPSRKLYSEYLKWLGNKYAGQVIKYEFRNKDKHQWSLTLHCQIERPNSRKVDIYKMASLDPYYYNFLQGNTYRESCYLCPYSQKKRVGDITLGDFWGVEYTHPDLFNINGVSSIIVNSQKGETLFASVSENIICEKVPYDSIAQHNGNLREPTKRPPIRDLIYKILDDKGFESIPYSISRKTYLIDTIKDKIPNRYRYRIKKLIGKI